MLFEVARRDALHVRSQRGVTESEAADGLEAFGAPQPLLERVRRQMDLTIPRS